MTEVFFAIAVFALTALGLGLGLAFGRGPVRTSCGAADRIVKHRCEDCPLRRTKAKGEGQ